MSLENVEAAKNLRDEFSEKLEKINSEIKKMGEESKKIEDKKSGFYLDRKEKITSLKNQRAKLLAQYDMAEEEFNKELKESKDDLIANIDYDMKVLDDNRNEEIRNNRIDELTNQQKELELKLELINNKINSVRDYLDRVEGNELYKNMYQSQLKSELEKQEEILKAIDVNKHELELLRNGDIENAYMSLQQTKMDIEKNFNGDTYRIYMCSKSSKEDINKEEIVEEQINNKKDCDKKKEEYVEEINESLRKKEQEQNIVMSKAEKEKEEKPIFRASEEEKKQEQENNSKKKKFTLKALGGTIKKFFGKIKEKIKNIQNGLRIGKAERLLLKAAEQKEYAPLHAEENIVKAGKNLAKTTIEKRKDFIDNISQDIDTVALQKATDVYVKKRENKKEIRGIKKQNLKKFISDKAKFLDVKNRVQEYNKKRAQKRKEKYQSKIDAINEKYNEER